MISFKKAMVLSGRQIILIISFFDFPKSEKTKILTLVASNKK